MESYLDILMKRAEMVRNWRKYVDKIAESVKRIMPDSRIYIFGGIVKGEAIGGSDVDILIVSKNTPKSAIKRAEIKIAIEELSNLPPYHPFESHLVDEEAMWYFNRVKELKEVKSM